LDNRLQDRVAVHQGRKQRYRPRHSPGNQARGAKVVLFGRDARTLERAATAIGGDTLTIQGDVRKLPDLERLFDKAEERFGKIDVVVANAGIAKFAPVDSLSEELFDELSDILFKGTFFTVQKALAHMRDGASIILVGSADADKQGRMGTSIYAAAKSAVRALVRSRWSCCRAASASIS
jgi:NAD(P)-dependent dehydrogenase (short-subunit alcohol dehydrogenase family)